MIGTLFTLPIYNSSPLRLERRLKNTIMAKSLETNLLKFKITNMRLFHIKRKPILIIVTRKLSTMMI